MSTLPTKQTPDMPSAETLEERFRRLEAAWLAEVGYSSSSTALGYVRTYSTSFSVNQRCTSPIV